MKITINKNDYTSCGHECSITRNAKLCNSCNKELISELQSEIRQLSEEWNSLNHSITVEKILKMATFNESDTAYYKHALALMNK